MIIYNQQALEELNIRLQAARASNEQLLAKDELDAINLRYPAYFYSPNIFIRIGLFILTAIILLFSFGLIALLFIDAIDKAVGGLVIFFGLACYAGLEHVVRNKRHLQSGVDDALLWIAVACVFGGISYLSEAGDITNAVLLFVIAGYCSLRFADRVMSLVAYLSLLGILFFSCTNLGTIGKAIVPFVLMAASAISYVASKKMNRQYINLLYAGCLQAITVAALISIYVAGNYFVVRELSIAMFNLDLPTNAPIPMGWLFWIFTIAIPVIYIIRGIQRKDILLVRVGLLLVAVIVFTIRYYYAVAPVEVVMTLGGAVLILLSYGLTKYLHYPKFGFTNVERSFEASMEKTQVESLLQAQTLTTPAIAENAGFGGGNFGGGGATGEF